MFLGPRCTLKEAVRDIVKSGVLHTYTHLSHVQNSKQAIPLDTVINQSHLLSKYLTTCSLLGADSQCRQIQDYN